jgi:bacterial/archaeal transporter family-2 protein
MIGLIVVAVIVGVILPVQAGVNAQLRSALGHPLAAALVSFTVGTVGLGVLALALRTPVPFAAALGRSPWWHWVGGLLGAIYVAGTIVLAPRLGAATLIAAVVAGQMLASLVLDQYGWVGFAAHPVTLARALGAALVVTGVILVQR